jgi:NADPH:quinone reductase-like Zn-dependent oxidoreductase
MKAAVIDSLERGPRFADFAEPVVTGGETLVEVTAAGLHPIVRMLASGEHLAVRARFPNRHGSTSWIPSRPPGSSTTRTPSESG